ncbi:hypothetical protein SAMN05216228_103653 [Rhizobium tibeticum]|uniref:Uncharacterized protein n=1 Tax=Rhizobium tibeticum TaxID=501024 RepID=A0A1H8UUV0_9HYPH|nr:hypothetical protein RTCCBAU85039_5757 [Rhizobium tibeticum]SEP06982.1 hypothetical protein SAMN05216228_103653 [Rhizobium tibeticum]
MLSGYAAVTDTIVPQLIFTLNVAWEIASRESPDYDLVVYFIQQAIQAAQEEALRHGTVIASEGKSELQ